MNSAERRAALDVVAAEVTACTRCRLHQGRTRAVPGEGHPDTEVAFVGEGPGMNEDRAGRPFVGRAGDLLVRFLGTIGWKRDEVFITNVVKCRPPDNRDPEPDEIAACQPYLERQLAILDPALIVTLGRHSMARFIPGAKISQVHGTLHPGESAGGGAGAMIYAMYHPAAALRSSDVERQSYDDAAGIPAALLQARARRSVSANASANPIAPPPAVEAVGPDRAAAAPHPSDAPPPASTIHQPSTTTDPAPEAPTLF